jgi:acetolactate synthase-1/3 small subunit
MNKRALSILVENNPNVLSHVSGLFSRRGYNIDSISAGETQDPRFTRITIVASGDELILEQIEKQVEKLEDVLHIEALIHGASDCRELVLVKIRAKGTDRAAIMSIVEIFRAKIVDVSTESMIIELTGNKGKLEAFLGLVADYEILELARTGITGLTRGSGDII